MRRLLPLLFLSSCTIATRPALLKFEKESARSKTGWTRVESPAFTLLTDFSPGTAQEAAQDIAGELAAVESAFGNSAPRFETKLVVVVYSNGIDFEERFGRWRRSFTRLDPGASRHFLYLWGRPTRWVHHNMVGASESSGSTLRQVLAHAVLARMISITVLPQWLMYGLGGYVETLAWSEDGRSIELGAINTTLLAQYQRDNSLGFSDVIGPQQEHPLQEEAYLRAYEGYCWAVVHTAINLHPGGLAKYLAALADGGPADPTIMFDGASPEAIDTEVQRFMRSGRFTLRTVPVEAHVVTAKVGPVPENELPLP